MQAFLRERFELIRVLRRSPTILTFLARDTWNSHGTKVVRVIRSTAVTNARSIEDHLSWFHGCRHPHLSPLHECLHTPRGDGVVLRGFVEGEPGLNLESNIEPLRSLLSICLFLREQGVVHGAIHNGNLIRTPDGGLSLVDGGIRGLAGGSMVASEVHWLAPEILRGGDPTLEADLYALGALLHHACFGTTLFADSDCDRLRLKYLHAKPTVRRTAERVSVVDPEIVIGLMNRDPGKRSQYFDVLVGLLSVRSKPAEQAAFVGNPALLRRFVNPLEQDVGCVRATLVEGTSGMGKTRLLDEVGFRARLRGHRVAHATAYERGNRRFEPIVQVIADWAFRSPSDFSDWFDTDGIAFHDTLGALVPEACQSGEIEKVSLSIEQMAADLAAILILMARRYGSLLVLLDDLHWADSGTWLTIRHLALRRNDARLSVVMSIRQPPGSALTSSEIRTLRSAVESVSLEPLDSKSAQLVAGALLRKSTHRHLRDAVLSAHGNPLILEQLARAKRSRKIKLSLPASSALTAVFDHADTRVQRMAETLSLFVGPIDHNIMASLSSEEALSLEVAFASLLASGLFSEQDGRLRFRHDGVRRAVYDRIPKNRRARLHSWAYSVLCKLNATEDTLAFHAGMAGLSLAAARLYRRSAMAKLQSFDFGGACEAFKAALLLSDRASETTAPEVLLAYAECLSSMGKMRSVSRLLPEQTISTWAPAHRSRAYEVLGAATRSRPRESVPFFERAVLWADPGAPGRYLCLMRLALAYALAGTPRRAERLLPQLWDAIQASHSKEYERLYAVVLTSLCRYGDALEMFGDEISGDPFELQVLTSKGLCSLYLGEIDGALRFHSAALHLSRKRGSLAAELVALLNLATTHLVAGRFDRAEPLLVEADGIRHASLSDGSDALTFPLLIADEIELRTSLGEYDRAGRLLRRRFTSTLESPPTYPSVFLMLRAAQYFAATCDEGRRRAAIRYVRESEMLDIPFFRRELVLYSTDWLDERTFPDAATMREGTSGPASPHHKSNITLLESVALARRGANADARLKLQKLLRSVRLRKFRTVRSRAAVVLGLCAERAPHAIRYFRAAVRMARSMRLAEVEASALSAMANREASRGNHTGAYRCASRGIRLLRRLSATVPRRSRRSYSEAGWRTELVDMMKQMSFEVNNLAASAHFPGSTASAYFATICHLAGGLNEARSPEQAIKTFGEALSCTGRTTVIAGLGEAAAIVAHGDGELTARLTDALPQLVDRPGSVPFFGSVDVRIRAEVVSHPVAWFPLSYRSTRLGGVCVDLSKKDMTDAELDLCTVAARMISTTLAALLWAPSPGEIAAAVTGDDGIVGSSGAIGEVKRLIGIAAASDASTLIEGESGTGKELVAQAIHARSSRRDGPLVTVDCGAIPEGLIESELFGAKKGAFTGAHADRAGMIESAHGGTLFLDEIGNTSASLQVKLLRVLQERKVRRVGENRGRTVDIRLIAATNADLQSLVDKGQFRKDLYYRINVLHIVIPPLRDRQEDISELALSFLGTLNRSHGTRKRFGTNALGDLMAGHYEGNVRELQNVVERAFFMSGKKTVIQEVGQKNGGERGKENDIASWFEELRSGRQNFWEAVHQRYKRRDISRQKVTALMHVGLRETRGSYKNLAQLLHVRDSEYRRFMDFLRRNKCQPDFRPYRRMPPP